MVPQYFTKTAALPVPWRKTTGIHGPLGTSQSRRWCQNGHDFEATQAGCQKNAKAMEKPVESKAELKGVHHKSHCLTSGHGAKGPPLLFVTRLL